jgi:hypothetical protein
MTNTKSPKEEKAEKEPVKYVKEITLPSGKTAQIFKAKGYHIQKVMRIIDGSQDKFISAYMAVCCTIDNQNIVMEDLEEMDGSDYLQLMGDFSEINFPSLPGK